MVRGVHHGALARVQMLARSSATVFTENLYNDLTRIIAAQQTRGTVGASRALVLFMPRDEMRAGRAGSSIRVGRRLRQCECDLSSGLDNRTRQVDTWTPAPARRGTASEEGRRNPSAQSAARHRVSNGEPRAITKIVECHLRAFGPWGPVVRWLIIHRKKANDRLRRPEPPCW